MSGTVFLFGKLPSRGEFTSRGLAPAERQRWDAWCCAVMDDGAERLGEGFEAAFDATLPWRFGMSLADGSWQAGCIAPACDRHGRRFPLVLGRKGTGAPASLFLAGIAAAMAEAVQAAFAPMLDLEAFLPACGVHVADPAAPAPEMTDWRHDWIGR